MRVRLLAGAGLFALLAGAVLGWQAARDAGAFGCAYKNREHVAVVRLAPKPPHFRVRIGDGLRLDLPDGGLRDVRVSGGAGLAPGTQNGVSPNRDYVFRVTGTGDATLTAVADGSRVSATVTSHC